MKTEMKNRRCFPCLQDKTFVCGFHWRFSLLLWLRAVVILHFCCCCNSVCCRNSLQYDSPEIPRIPTQPNTIEIFVVPGLDRFNTTHSSVLFVVVSLVQLTLKLMHLVGIEFSISNNS